MSQCVFMQLTYEVEEDFLANLEIKCFERIYSTETNSPVFKTQFRNVVQSGYNCFQTVLFLILMKVRASIKCNCYKAEVLQATMRNTGFIISRFKHRVMAHSHCTGPGQGQEPGNDGFLYYATCIYCSHYTGTGTETGNHCFLLYPSRSLSLSLSRSWSRAV